MVSLFILSLLCLIIYFTAQKKKHPSQLRIKSFLVLLLPLVGVFFFGMFVVNMIDKIFHFDSPIFINASVGGLLIAIILTWRSSVARISRPSATNNNLYSRLKERFQSLRKRD